MTDIPEKKHALLSPSGADRWAVCPGSVVLEAGREDRGSVYADWGTVCHEVADIILQTAIGEVGGLPWWNPQNAEGFIGRVFTVGDKEYEFDHEMADCVNDYIAHVESFWEPGDILMPESQVPLTHITGEEDATGTSDCIIIKPGSREIVVIDLKTGKGVMVDADENRQGIMYASGSAHEHDLFHGPFDTVRIVIIQPRLHHVSEWACDWIPFLAHVGELQFAAERVRVAQMEYDDGFVNGAQAEEWFGVFLNPTEKGCRFCKAKAICPALKGEVSSALALTAPPARVDEFPDLSLPKQAAAAVPEDMGTVESGALAKAYHALKLIEQWVDAVRKEVHARLHDGAPVGDLCLYEGKQGNRMWSDKDKAEERMKKARVKTDVMYKKSVISPSEAEKLNKEGVIPDRVFADLAEFIIRAPNSQPTVGTIGDPKKTPWSPARAEEFPDLDAADQSLDELFQ